MSVEPVVVLGAGVIGLSVGIRLAEAGHSVRMLARELPLESTSAAAAAIWYPYRIQPMDRTLAWAGRSRAEFEALAADPVTGVVLRAGVELLREPTCTPWWSPLVPDLRRLDAPPAPYVDGWSFVTPIVEMPVYLGWMQARFESLGGTLTRVDLAQLPSDASVVVNCTGLGARTLVDDPGVRPVRGQVLVMSQVGVETWVLDGGGLTYVVPRSHDIVVGGTDVEDDWSTTPDPDVATQLLDRAIALVPALAEAEVLGHKVGLRPARSEVRLEVEQRIPEQRVVHCYGHGGAGVTVSWGCSDEVVSLVEAAGLAPADADAQGVDAAWSGFVMLVFLVALAALIWFAPRSSRAGSGVVVTPAELDAVKYAADEDAAALADAMLELDVVLSGQRLSKALRKDYQVAYDSLQTALQTVPTVTKPDQLRRVAEHLVGGGYAIACVRARVAHQRVPKQRTPCFFNPQHGPSVSTVPWAPEGGMSRQVPACASDVQRVAAGVEPDVRQVLVDEKRVSYWQAGAAFAPWIAGYFEAFGSIGALFEGTPAGGVLSGPPSGGSRRRSR